MLRIDSLVIEATRRCNLACEHCLRGDAQDIDFDPHYLREFISSSGVDYIGCLTISGGEPSLVPNVISGIIDVLEYYNVEVGNFYIATNGVSIPLDFIAQCARLYVYCCDNEITQVRVSNDNFHTEALDSKLITALAFGTVSHKMEKTLKGGRARDFGDFVIILDSLELDDEDDNTIINWPTIYLNCNGKVIAGCDWSYEDQRDYIISDVENFCIEKLIAKFDEVGVWTG